MAIDRNSALPKYLQLQNILVQQIQSGGYKAGDKLSTDIELKKRYRLSTSTVTRALYELEQAGFVVRKQGAGTFVKSLVGRSDSSLSKSESLSNDRVLFICGAAPSFDQSPENTNWFIGHEIYRGLVNSFEGRVRIVSPEDLLSQIDASVADEKFVALTSGRSKVQDQLRHRNVPFVIIDQQNQTSRIAPDTVSTDHVRGVYEAMVYLIEDLGHRDVVFIGPDRQKLDSQHRARWAGYVMGLQAFDIPVRDELAGLAETGTIDGACKAMRDVLSRKVKFSAVFADTDIKAVGAIRALRDAGLKVPEDVSVVGFDDVPGVEKHDPPLTTVRMPYFEAGAAAVKLLEMPADEDGNREGRMLTSRLVVRDSCAPAKSRAIAG